MNKYHLFDYEPHEILGDDLKDALERQAVIKTPIRHRRNEPADGTPHPEGYHFETLGGEEILVDNVLEVKRQDENITRGNKSYEIAVVELPDRRIIEIDAYPVEEPGRPPLYGETMTQTAVRLPGYQIDWLKQQPEGISAKLRELVDQAMQFNS